MDRAAAMGDLLDVDAVLERLEVSNKKQLLQEMANKAASVLGLEEHVLFDVLWERERLGTTGVGAGIAIPHGRVPGLEKVRGFFARLVNPVPFESVDDKPVDLVFLLLAPEGAGADHLHALATVSRVLRDPKLCEEVRQAKNASAIMQILVNAKAANAA